MDNELTSFLLRVERPLVIVSALPFADREAVVDFLFKLNAPVYLEGVSGIREEPRLQHLRITYVQKLWQISEQSGYKIDGILRIGGVPTLRPWRDLEDFKSELPLCSLSHLPFSGNSRGGVIHVNLKQYLSAVMYPKIFAAADFREWLAVDRACLQSLLSLFEEEPCAEPSLFYYLSKNLPQRSLIYLGNSLPIREWDLAASFENKSLDVFASRGLNGIDGQVSTFLGMALPGRENWGIFGDLTFLYDMAGPWVLKQMQDVKVNLAVINNAGGKIFDRMFPHPEFQNLHGYTMEYIARHWGLDYCGSIRVPDDLEGHGNRLIELFPDRSATDRFWERYKHLADQPTITL